MHILLKAFCVSLFLVLAMLMLCCQNHQQVESDFYTLNDFVTIKSKKFRKENDSLEKVVIEQMRNGVQVTTYWLPRAQNFRLVTQEAYAVIDSTRRRLLEAGFVAPWDSVYASLIHYEEKILRVDPEITEVIEQRVNWLSYYVNSVNFKSGENCPTCISGKMKDEQLYILGWILNRIEEVENETLKFCVGEVFKGAY